jgi:hypothetical protein
MDVASSNMHQAMDESHKRIDKILLIKQDNVQSIGKRLNEIVNSCLEIDIRGVQSESNKRPRFDEELALA